MLNVKTTKVSLHVKCNPSVKRSLKWVLHTSSPGNDGLVLCFLLCLSAHMCVMHCMLCSERHVMICQRSHTKYFFPRVSDNVFEITLMKACNCQNIGFIN